MKLRNKDGDAYVEMLHDRKSSMQMGINLERRYHKIPATRMKQNGIDRKYKGTSKNMFYY